jgi:hypothetical protein
VTTPPLPISVGPVFNWAEPSQLQLDPLVVVVVDVPLQSSLQILKTAEPVQVIELRFECGKKAFHDGIVQAVASSGHAGDNISIAQQLSIRRHSILPALI